MKDNNIKPLKLPPTPKPTLLSGKEYPRLPKQTLINLKDRKNIGEIVVFSYTPRNWKKQYRVTLKQCDDPNKFVFYVKNAYSS